jgi:hypothetical protein
MDVNELNNLLSGLTIKEESKELNKTEIDKEKTKVNNFMCFRDIDFASNTTYNESKPGDLNQNYNTQIIDFKENKEVDSKYSNINNKLNDRNNLFLERKVKIPIFEDLPKSTREINKKYGKYEK